MQPAGCGTAARFDWADDTQIDKNHTERREVLMQRRKLLLAVAVTGILTLAPAGLRAQGGTPATQNTGQKNWKDRAEYDLYDAITKDQNDQSRLEKLNQWREKYPTTDFIDLRQQGFLTTYAKLGKIQEALSTAKEILARDPKDFTALYYTALLTPQLAAVNVTPTEDQLSAAENAAKAILAGAKPSNVSDADWQKAKNDVEAIAHKTLGWVAMQRKQPEQAESEFKTSLGMNPKDSEIAYWLGIVILQERKPEKQSEALYYYARAASYDGPGALAAAGRDVVKKQLTDLYTKYHGSADGLDQLLATAKTQPEPGNYKILSTVDIEKQKLEKQQADAAAHPDIALWNTIKTALMAPDGQTYFTNSMKGALLPGGANGVQKFKGAVISMEPATRPKTVVIGIADPKTPDATLKFDTPLPGKVDPGTVLSFSGIAESYSTSPFMVTFTVDRKNLEGWTGTNPAPARRAPARRRAK
jgi:tetratricopeptide (TPR) repeat protein